MNTNFLSEITVVILTYKTDRDILYNCLNSIDKKVKIQIIENSTKFEKKDEFLKIFLVATILSFATTLVKSLP